MHRIIEFSLKNRFLILVLTLLLVGAGVRALGRLPIDAVPDVTPNQVLVLTNSPGLGPVEVEKCITFPVESAMSGLPGITRIRSVSKPGLSAVTVYFQEEMDLYFCRRLVMERLPEAREAIPPGFGAPELGPISTELGEVYQFEVRGEGYSLFVLLYSAYGAPAPHSSSISTCLWRPPGECWPCSCEGCPSASRPGWASSPSLEWRS